MLPRRKPAFTILAALLVALLALGTASNAGRSAYAQTPAPTPQPVGGSSNEINPAPPSIGADVPVTYFGPPPSSVQKELIGPYQLVKAGTINMEKLTITLPLYQGKLTSGELVWYVLVDTNDRANADALGLNFSGKLTYADTGKAVRPGTLEKDGTVTFARGKVDFAPELQLTPGDAPNYFPPKVAKPGSVGDADYSPLAKVGNYIYNAPIVAFNVDAKTLDTFCDGKADHKITHNKVVAICPREGTVTVSLTLGHSFARPVLYMSMDASNDLAAAMEDVTIAPAMNDIHLGGDDSAFSAVERIFPVVNGPMGKENPQRQGFNSALAKADRSTRLAASLQSRPITAQSGT